MNEPSLVFDRENKDFYVRNHSTIRTQLENNLLEYYQCSPNDYHCNIFSSGINAIACLMEVCCFSVKKPYFLVGNELYSDDDKIFKYLNSINPSFKIATVDVRDTDRIIDIFNKQNITLFFIESCTNPSGQFFDPSLIQQLKNLCPDCIFAVDNTWLSAYLYNPLTYDFDVVIESMTKYISAGKCIGGMMISNNKLSSKIQEWSRAHGQFIPDNMSQIFIEELTTIQDRLDKSSFATYDIAQFLEKNENVEKVMYPALESHPTFKTYSAYVSKGPSLIWFALTVKNHKQIKHILYKKIKNQAKIFNDVLKIETSYGSGYSKIDNWPKVSCIDHYNYPSDWHGNERLWIRLYVGYETDIEELIYALEKFFEYIYE